MGTFYRFCADCELTAERAEAWLGLVVAPVFPWTLIPCTVRELIDRVIAGGGETNGELVHPLLISVGPGRVRWSWSGVPSEIGPEVRQLAFMLWESLRSCASEGVFGYRDDLGPESLWDMVEVLADGRSTRIDRWLPSLLERFDVVPNEVEGIPF